MANFKAMPLTSVHRRRNQDRAWIVSWLGTLFSLGALSGCATIADLAAELVEFIPTTRVETVWSRRVGSGSNKRYLKLSPAVADGRVYAASRNGTVEAIDALSGARIWETDVPVPISGGPGTGSGLVLVGSSEGKVLALAAETGDLLWSAAVSSEVLSAPRASQDIVVARTIDGKVFGLSTSDGSRVWVYDRTAPILTLRGTSAPAIAQGIVVVGFDSGRLVALTIDNGQALWETRVAQPKGRSELERLVDIDADPVIVGNTVYVVTFQGRIAAIDLQTGNIVWRRDMSSHAGIGIGARHLYVTDDLSEIWALNPGDSTSIWHQPALRGREATSPTGFQDYVVVGDSEGYVHWMRADDGTFVARLKVDSDGIIAAPVAVGDLVYVYGKGGDLVALRVAQ